MTTKLELDEDFTGAFIDGALLHTGAGVWVIDGTGTEAPAVMTSESNAPGILSLATGTSTNDTCRAIFGAQSLVAASQVVDFSVRFRLFGTLDSQVLVGLFSDPDDLPGSAVARYVGYDTSGPDFYLSASSNGGSDVITSTVAGATAFVTARFRKTGDGALAATTYTDASGTILARAVHDANFVNTTQVFLVAQVKTLTAASRGLQIDRITLRTGDLSR